ncbi:MAG TPA: 50S ribosomal protein L14 [Firmicutes bacterium]|nr:50S ribosomal protein L14 [Caldisericia bacterium]HDH63243.1 50S ribosomal protein L14 [Bacillota bacterium]
MIRPQTRLKVADNTGAKEVMCIRILGAPNKLYGRVGDVIVFTVKDAIPNSPIPKGTVGKGVIVRTRNRIRRPDGSYVRFDDNAVVIIDEDGNPKGTRIFGPVCRELREKGYLKIISLAAEVV